MSTLEQTFKQEVQKTLEHLREIEGLHHFRIRLTARGPIHHGTFQIQVELSDRYGENLVTGNSLPAVLAEYIRRCGWEKTHAPLSIPYMQTDPRATTNYGGTD